METTDSEYFNSSKELINICRKTDGPDFDNFNKKELENMLLKARTLLQKCRSKENNEAFNLLEFRIKSNLESIKNKNRFIIQVLLSIVILFVSIFALFYQF